MMPDAPTNGLFLPGPRRPRTRSGSDERQSALAMVRAGMLAADVAKSLGRSPSTVSRWIAEAEAAAEIARLNAKVEAMQASRARIDVGAETDAWLQARLDEGHAASHSIWVTTLARAHTCLRAAVFGTVLRNLGEPWTVERSRSTERGNLAEITIARVLQERGIQLDPKYTQARLTDADTDPEGAATWPLSGRIDGRFPKPDGRGVEFKSMDGQVFETLLRQYDRVTVLQESGERLFPEVGWQAIRDSSMEWVAHYYRQVQCYMMLSGDTEWALVCWNASRVQALQIDVPRDQDCIDELRALLAMVRACCDATYEELRQYRDPLNDNVLASLPERPGVDCDPPCERCDYCAVCQPNRRFKLTTKLVKDTRLVDACRDVLEWESASKIHDKAEKFAKERFKEYAAENAEDASFEVIAGPYSLKGKQSSAGAWRVDIAHDPHQQKPTEPEANEPEVAA